MSTLSLSCPASIKAGVIGGITGQLTPAVAAAGLELRVTPPAGGVVTQAVTTGVDGSYMTAIPMMALGVWTVTAHWAGSTNLRPADSTPCQVTITQ